MLEMHFGAGTGDSHVQAARRMLVHFVMGFEAASAAKFTLPQYVVGHEGRSGYRLDQTNRISGIPTPRRFNSVVSLPSSRDQGGRRSGTECRVRRYLPVLYAQRSGVPAQTVTPSHFYSEGARKDMLKSLRQILDGLYSMVNESENVQMAQQFPAKGKKDGTIFVSRIGKVTNVADFRFSFATRGTR
jgi:hypothetical protein